MSETEHKIGKLIPVDMIGGLEETAKRVLKEMDCDPCDYHDTFLEQLEDDGYRKFVILDDMIYKVECEEIDPYNDIMNATQNEDRTISFEVKYYNGGCSFNEAIQTSVDKMNGIDE